MENVIDENRGLGFPLEMVGLSELPFSLDGIAVNTRPATFNLIGIPSRSTSRIGWPCPPGSCYPPGGPANIFPRPPTSPSGTTSERERSSVDSCHDDWGEGAPLRGMRPGRNPVSIHKALLPFHVENLLIRYRLDS